MTQELIERLHKLADRQRRERGNAMYLGEHDPEISEAADALQSQSARIAEQDAALERFEGFAITMFRAFLVGLERNKAHRWVRESSDVAERNLKDALKDYRLSLTKDSTSGS